MLNSKRNKTLTACFIAVLLYAPSQLWAITTADFVSLDWKVKRDKQGIRVSTAKVPDNPHKAVRAEMTVKSSVNSLVALVLDLDSCSKWADLCKSSYYVNNNSTADSSQVHSPQTRSQVFTHNDLPFPVADRVALADVQWSVEPESGSISMISEAINTDFEANNIEPIKGAVRIEYAHTEWHFTPQADGTTLVESYAHIDPNGPVPAWLSNMLLVSSPHKTLKRMRTIVEAGEYSNQIVPFLADK